eukprot:9136022-Ditylum_brightwellii.AAC.1
MATRNRKKTKTEDSMDTDTSSTSLASHEYVVLFTGAYEVVVHLGSGKLKKATVLIWSIAKPHSEKPSSFTEAVVMHNPSFDGT